MPGYAMSKALSKIGALLLVVPVVFVARQQLWVAFDPESGGYQTPRSISVALFVLAVAALSCLLALKVIVGRATLSEFHSLGVALRANWALILFSLLAAGVATLVAYYLCR